MGWKAADGQHNSTNCVADWIPGCRLAKSGMEIAAPNILPSLAGGKRGADSLVAPAPSTTKDYLSPRNPKDIAFGRQLVDVSHHPRKRTGIVVPRDDSVRSYHL